MGGLLLVHSAYSSFEFHQLVKSTHETHGLPLDITVESICGIIVIIVGAVRSVENGAFYKIAGKDSGEVDSVLNDVQINERIYSNDKYLKPIEMKQAVALTETIGLSDYQELVTRVDFIDIIQKRKDYANWLETIG